ncbi:hypothetical protein [Thiomonas sp. FB-6]|uniref:hypothetical protein n=1 Tax=Thiomonas sp. FB-6 TaxID=1158291 RepID=UPI000364139B|nr:hypothetical protein [Thiomonas sp. FB-6]
MPTLLMCPYGSDVQSLRRWHDVPEGSLRDSWGLEPRLLSPKLPYLLGSDHGEDERDYCSTLAPYGGLLCDMCQDFGSPATVALAELTSDFQRYASTGLAGGGSVADVYRKRVGRFLGAMRSHQEAIDAYHRATRRGAPEGPPRNAARAALQRTGDELNQMFRQELGQLTKTWSPRTTMLVSGRVVVPDRVRQKPKISRLDVRSRTEAWMLTKLGTSAKYLSRGFLVIDLGIRVQRVNAVSDSGGTGIGKRQSRRPGLVGPWSRAAWVSRSAPVCSPRSRC